ncbi:type-1 angiotensin II receptor-associated protein-like isoform X2 [Mercenaria mercenaria]|uniref:type-1 angiotensin II receptor-associated protein-like isoform X2 n=1 Tax=Mercenaria mercenaria TaxID=6596 RepID=UPI001E1DA0BA|nr:type-1 angiotensin II receptor-associated protein-like isoform X2 [Mercenaria mercenaria]XP_045162866.1 type-1 angiotensin II receptor-associated protein-like isoform X2 [Mercenaria mercenaria]
MNPPQITLKLIVFLHFIFTTWACMCPQFLPLSYTYMNLFVLSLGVWSIVHHESSDAALMFMMCHLFSILHDIILLGIYEPRGYAVFEQNPQLYGTPRNEYRFSLGMAIVNLIAKPITAFLIYRIYRERGGSYSDFNIPGVGSLPGFGGSPQHSAYEDIDTPAPTNPGGMDDHQPYDPSQQPYSGV